MESKHSDARQAPTTTTTDSARAIGPKHIYAAIWLAVVSPVFFLLLPQIVGVLARAGLTPEQLGMVSSVDLFGTMLASTVLVVNIRRVSWRKLILYGLAGHVLFNALAAAFHQDFTLLMVCRFVTGICNGLIMSTVFVIVADSARPDRYTALLVVCELLFSAMALYLVPAIGNFGGPTALFAALAAVTATGYFVAHLIPHSGMARPHAAGFLPPFRPSFILALIIEFLFFFGFIITWAYVERIGMHLQVPEQNVAAAISSSVLISILAMFLVVWLDTRIPRLISVLLGFAGMATAALLFGMAGTTTYLLATLLLRFANVFALPYLAVLIIVNDPSGRGVVLKATVQGLALSAGPYFASLFVEGGNYLVVTVLSTAVCAAGLICVGILYRMNGNWDGRVAETPIPPQAVTAAVSPGRRMR